MYFWPAVREHHPDGNSLAGEATGQEQEAKEVLARLDELDAHEAEFGNCWRSGATRTREKLV
jgi:hypothetical protein